MHTHSIYPQMVNSKYLVYIREVHAFVCSVMLRSPAWSNFNDVGIHHFFCEVSGKQYFHIMVNCTNI